MAAFTATPFRGHGLSSVAVTTTFGAMHRLSSIVESRYARNYIPKFQAEFHIAEEEPDGPRLGLPSAPLTTPPPLPVPHHLCLPDGGVAETREAPSNEGASLIGSSHSMAEYKA